MATVENAILQDIIAALRGSKQFAIVLEGEGGSETQVPRACLLLKSQELFPADDDPACRWLRLNFSLVLRTRGDSGSDGLARLQQLSRSACDALLADPYRGMRCCDLPIGRATETGCGEINARLKRPEMELSLSVRCHLEIQEHQP